MMANSCSSLKAQLFDLADQDRAAIARIRERLELNSNALAVRLAIRELARRLEAGQLPAQQPAQDAKGQE
jgi:hypothetical protein